MAGQLAQDSFNCLRVSGTGCWSISATAAKVKPALCLVAAAATMPCAQLWVQIISSSLGPPSLTDVHGGTFATATPLPATSNADGLTSTGASYGIIQGSSDVDMFSFNTTAAGCVQVTVTVPPRFGSEWTWARSDLAVGVAVLDASNNVLAASSGLGVSTSAVVPAAGTYYVSLSSVGMNDPATTGFSNYASAGQYKVTATYPITSPAASSYTADVAPLPPSVLLQC